MALRAKERRRKERRLRSCLILLMLNQTFQKTISWLVMRVFWMALLTFWKPITSLKNRKYREMSLLLRYARICLNPSQTPSARHIQRQPRPRAACIRLSSRCGGGAPLGCGYNAQLGLYLCNPPRKHHSLPANRSLRNTVHPRSWSTCCCMPWCASRSRTRRWSWARKWGCGHGCRLHRFLRVYHSCCGWHRRCRRTPARGLRRVSPCYDIWCGRRYGCRFLRVSFPWWLSFCRRGIEIPVEVGSSFDSVES